MKLQIWGRLPATSDFQALISEYDPANTWEYTNATDVPETAWIDDTLDTGLEVEMAFVRHRPNIPADKVHSELDKYNREKGMRTGWCYNFANRKHLVSYGLHMRRQLSPQHRTTLIALGSRAGHGIEDTPNLTFSTKDYRPYITLNNKNRMNSITHGEGAGVEYLLVRIPCPE